MSSVTSQPFGSLMFNRLALSALPILAVLSCGPSSTSKDVGDSQTPPTTAPETSAWLSAGHYLSWKCENAPSEKTAGNASIHVHGRNRICVNQKLEEATSPGANGAWPSGVAAVKEVYQGDDIATLYVEAKIQADSANGDGWYWYNGAPGANGTGATGRPECVGCHRAAGSDAEHPGPGDYVYTKVE